MRRLIPIVMGVLGLAGPVYSDDLVALSDNFNHAESLGNWQRHHVLYGFPDQVAVLGVDQVTPGALHIEPQVSTWFEDYCGPLLFKEVTGDFIVTTRIRVTGIGGGVPQSDFSLAGLMVKAPDPTPGVWSAGEANWMFLSTGMGTGGQPQFETKDTIDGESELILAPAPTGWLRLRIERNGATFTLSARGAGQAWQTLRVLDRPDLPETLQVGMTTYTDWPSVTAYPGGPLAFNTALVESPPGNRDLVAQYDWIRFRRPNSDGVNEIAVPAEDWPG